MRPDPVVVEEAVAALARVIAADPPSDPAALHLRVVRALDAFAARGLAIAPERIVPRLAASEADPSRSVLDLLVAILLDTERSAAAIVARTKAIAASIDGLSEEAAVAHAVRRVLIDPAGAIARHLPRDVVVQNDFRREELVRTWASAIGVPVESGGKLEDEARSARALARLDYRKIREDEERLAIERRVLAEHAAAVREKQRREAEALASAQRE